MFKESLICVILLVIVYQLYVAYCSSDSVRNNSRKEIKEHITITSEEEKVVHMEKPMQYETPQSFEHPTLGKPDQIIEEGYLFRMQNPNPWVAIIFNPNTKVKYIFILRIDENKNILSRYNDVMARWSEIIPNSRLNENSGELIVPANDENTALALSNLIINTFKGDLKINNIIENNLIQISLSKIKNHPSVKQKIKEQIMENLGKRYEDEQAVEYQEDLAETATASVSENDSPLPINKSKKSTNDDFPQAYEGGEFSYL